MFVLSSEITIGSYKCSGVHDVVAKRSIHSYVDTATIKLPSISQVLKKDGHKVENQITGLMFKDGDPVTINLGYDGDLKTEFKGFVKRRNLNMPLEVECEGYSYQMRNNSITNSWPKAKVSEILKAAIKGTDIRLQVDHDIELHHLRAVNNNGLEVLEMVLKACSGALNAFFVEPDLLWVGFIYIPAGEVVQDILNKETVKYRLGYNTIKDNSLKEREPIDMTIVVKNTENKRKRGTATKETTAGKKKTVTSNHISSDAVTDVKNSLTSKATYTGYEGKINALLKPFCQPGFKAFLADDRYREKDGTFICESTEVHFGLNGGRRIVEIGAKVQS